MHRFIIFFYIICLILLTDISMADSAYRNFQAKYNFEFSSMTIAKGKLAGEICDNNTAYKIKFSGKTTPIISIFYKLKEIIEGKVNIESKRDIYYKSFEDSSKKKKYTYVDFVLKNKAKVLVVKNEHKKEKTLTSKDAIYSPLSLYLFFVSNDFEFQKTYYRYVALSTNLYKVQITPIKYIEINLDKLGRDSGKRETIEVELKFYKVDKNGKTIANKEVKKVVVWIAKNKPNIPIRIESWHTIGTFRARLIDLKYK
jgi:hypothetical protein